jgi:hypothetical protein
MHLKILKKQEWAEPQISGWKTDIIILINNYFLWL